MAEEERPLAERVAELIEQEKPEEAGELISDLHPVDLAALLEEMPEEARLAAFGLLDDEVAGQVLDELPGHVTSQLLAALTPQRTSDILERMPSDEAADLLGELPQDEANQLLELMEHEEARELQELMGYEEDTAGGQMATEVLTFDQDLTVAQALERLREGAGEAATVYELFVVDSEQRLVGDVSLKELILADPDRRLREIMDRDVTAVSPEEDQEEVARLVMRYRLTAVPVVDQHRRVVGVVTIDDVVDVVEQEATEDLAGLSGAGEGPDEPLRGSLWDTLKARFPSLLAALVAGLLAALIIRSYGSAPMAQLALAAFLPALIIAAEGTSHQSAGIALSWLAEGEGRGLWAGSARALISGMALGAVCGAMVAGAALLWEGRTALGLAVGIAVWASVVAGSLIGTLLPVALARAGLDPAKAAAPLVTAAADLASVAIYFAVAVGLLRTWG